MKTFVLGLALVSLVLTSVTRADEKLKDIACRSVHLAYPSPPSVAFYNEIKVETSAPGTYFMVCGWSKGYFGIQELGNARKLLIFSVWDNATGDDPKKVDPEKRVKLIDHDPQVRIGRFGGEGTGGQSFFDYDWKIGSTYRFIVSCEIQGERTAYTGWFFVPETSTWKKLVTFSTITKGTPLQGLYSFVEDFKRDRQSTKLARRASFGNAWTMNTERKWNPLTTARFTADANPVLNIDAGSVGDRFYLVTGGDTQNAGTPLRSMITLPPPTEALTAPSDLPESFSTTPK